jgi:drug/metabolite transporter (DMT)-like permease
MASGALSLAAHAWLEPVYALRSTEWGWMILLGVGPMGAAFYLWDAALKRGDARTIGTLAYITPLLSTSLLALFGGGRLGWQAALALVLILAGAAIGNGLLRVVRKDLA